LAQNEGHFVNINPMRVKFQQKKKKLNIVSIIFPKHLKVI